MTCLGGNTAGAELDLQKRTRRRMIGAAEKCRSQSKYQHHDGLRYRRAKLISYAITHDLI
jgi:hypothetical protein